MILLKYGQKLSWIHEEGYIIDEKELIDGYNFNR